MRAPKKRHRIIVISPCGRAWGAVHANKLADTLHDAWWPFVYVRQGTCWGVPVYREQPLPESR